MYQGVTISVAFPKNIITPYVLTSKEQGKWQTNDYILAFIFIILVPLISLLISYKIWRKHGDDPRMVKTIIPEFEIPENLTPMEMGVIMKSGGFGNNVITASIVNLAVKGYLIMQEEKEKILFVKYNEYKFVRTEKEVDDKLYPGEAKLLEKLFEGRKKEVSFSSLKNRFYQEIPKISKIVIDDLAEKKIIVSKSKIYQMTMITIGIFIMFPGLWFIAFYWPIALAFFLSGLPVIIFGIFMPKRTEKGSELNWRISGFKYYMETAEKYRAQFYEKENMMEKLLPYAILFGMTKKWLENMKSIYGEEYFNTYHPSFIISSTAFSGFDSFTSSLNRISSGIASSVSSSSSGSSGGGSSGGGGGGGGGGGW